MPNKSHHIVPNQDGGWDLKKGGGKNQSSTLTTSKMLLISGERLAEIKIQTW